MVDVMKIKAINGYNYSYNPDTNLVYMDGLPLSSEQAEPIFSEMNGSVHFSGIYMKKNDSIISMSGKIHQNINIEILN